MQELDTLYHLKCKKGDVGRYVILPGDPGRCETIASHFDKPEHIGFNREFNIYSGYLNGEKVSVCSTGIGGPSAAIAMEELNMIGADTFIRVGTCGGIDMSVEADDIVIANGAIRFEHTSCEYAPIEYPAVPDIFLTYELFRASRDLGYKTHIGVVQCKDSFYGQHSPNKMPMGYELNDKWDAWKSLHVKASEMESSALFVVASTLKARCASVFHVVWNQEREKAGLDQVMVEDTTKSINVAIKALKDIIKYDKDDEIKRLYEAY